MHLLHFGSFVGILYPYVKNNMIADELRSSETDFIFSLLTSADSDVECGSSPAVASRYKTGVRAIPDSIVFSLHTTHARNEVVGYFRDNAIPYIERGRRDQLIRDLTDLLKQDTTIDEEFKNDMLKEAEPSTLAEFLSDLLIYAVSVDPTEKEKVYPVEHFNLPMKNDWFTGRSSELKQLEDNFTHGSRVQILYGMGGMGKSQIALQYVYRHYRSYSLIHWIDARTIDSVINCCRAFLKSKGIPVDNDPQSEVCRQYMNYMESRSDWLIVYDSRDYYTDDEYQQFIRQCLPKNPATGNILITTRNGRPIGKAPRIEVGTWAESEAAAFLLQRAGSEDAEAAKKLAARLGYFPLALELAGAYIYATPGFDFLSYLGCLGKSVGILDEKTELTDYSRTIREIILLTIDRIRRDRKDDEISKILPELLHLCAYCAPNHIDIKAFAYLPAEHPRDESNECAQNRKMICEICSDELRHNELVRVLTRYALMRADAEGYLSIHELQQEVIRSCAFAEDAGRSALMTFQRYSSQYEKYDRSHYYCVTHVAAIADRLAKDEEQKDGPKDKISELKLASSIQQIRVSVDRYRLLVLEHASDDEMRSAHETVLETVRQTAQLLSSITDRPDALRFIIAAIDGFNYALSFYTQINVFNSALAFARFSLSTVYFAVNQYSLSDVLDADIQEARSDPDVQQGFLVDLLEDLEYCLCMCFFRGYYSDYIVPHLKDLPELLEPYAKQSGWPEDKLSDYLKLIDAYVEKDLFSFPESARNRISAKYGRPFEELAKEATDKLIYESS